jgi:2-oxoglutarate ferredoxin oxidoreductase subunit delta
VKLWRKPFDQEARATRPATVTINKERCKGCEYCVEFCPTEALAMSTEMNAKGYLLPKVADESKCLGCGLCEAICSDFAIFVISKDGEGST